MFDCGPDSEPSWVNKRVDWYPSKSSVIQARYAGMGQPEFSGRVTSIANLFFSFLALSNEFQIRQRYKFVQLLSS